MAPYHNVEENCVSPRLDFSSDLFDPLRVLSSRNVLLPYPKSKTYNNLAEYYTHTFGNNSSASRVSSKKSRNESYVLTRNYSWYFATLGIEYDSDPEKDDHFRSERKSVADKENNKLPLNKRRCTNSSLNFPALKSERIIELKGFGCNQKRVSVKRITDNDPNTEIEKEKTITNSSNKLAVSNSVSNTNLTDKSCKDNSLTLMHSKNTTTDCDQTKVFEKSIDYKLNKIGNFTDKTNEVVSGKKPLSISGTQVIESNPKNHLISQHSENNIVDCKQTRYSSKKDLNYKPNIQTKKCTDPIKDNEREFKIGKQDAAYSTKDVIANKKSVSASKTNKKIHGYGCLTRELRKNITTHFDQTKASKKRDSSYKQNVKVGKYTDLNYKVDEGEKCKSVSNVQVYEKGLEDCSPSVHSKDPTTENEQTMVSKKSFNFKPNDKIGNSTDLTIDAKENFMLVSNMQVLEKTHQNSFPSAHSENNTPDLENRSVDNKDYKILEKEDFLVKHNEAINLSNHDSHMNVENVNPESENSLKDKTLLQLARKVRSKLHSNQNISGENYNSFPNEAALKCGNKVNKFCSLEINSVQKKDGFSTKTFHSANKAANEHSISQKNYTTSKNSDHKNFSCSSKNYSRKNEDKHHDTVYSQSLIKGYAKPFKKSILRSKENISTDNGPLKVSISRKLIDVQFSKSRNKDSVSKEKKLALLAKHESVLSFLGNRKVQNFKIPHRKKYRDYRKRWY